VLTLTIHFIVINVSVGFVLIYRPHPVYFIKIDDFMRRHAGIYCDLGLTHIIINVCCIKFRRFFVNTFWRIFNFMTPTARDMLNQ
jgi:hypothetical protein